MCPATKSEQELIFTPGLASDRLLVAGQNYNEGGGGGGGES